ncbi:hypothetical protein AG1IA_05337 [Rhizoctonia solani AG-1 IA]|uniref:Uncharacterized protein n=1 Tax=Thanatephorus cucumeris (strain AG1-IA) TaxID=983506 RepID=L8WR52_THACA|nr:hypothetical protein AG1IA_05337 [Rhizoctonia solani AG-1 IA]
MLTCTSTYYPSAIARPVSQTHTFQIAKERGVGCRFGCQVRQPGGDEGKLRGIYIKRMGGTTGATGALGFLGAYIGRLLAELEVPRLGYE